MRITLFLNLFYSVCGSSLERFNKCEKSQNGLPNINPLHRNFVTYVKLFYTVFYIYKFLYKIVKFLLYYLL